MRVLGYDLRASFFAVLLASLGCLVAAQERHIDFISKGFTGSDLNWVDQNGVFLHSVGGWVSASFYSVGNDYYVCISYRGNIIWAANRKHPVSRADKLVFGSDGNVKLTASDGTVVFATNTGENAETLQLQDNGNLVVRDAQNRTLWQSFDFPTDTLMVGQKLRPGMRLVSSTSSLDFSEGPYALELLDDSLQLVMSLGGQKVPYWVMANDTRVTLLSSMDSAPAFASMDARQLSLYNSDSTPQSSLLLSSNNALDNSTVRLLQLGPEGNLRSTYFYSSGSNKDFTLMANDCDLPNHCGPYGVCFSMGQCKCPSQLQFVNNSDYSKGCGVPTLNLCKEKTAVKFMDLDPGLSYFGVEYADSVPASSVGDCKALCEKNCSCTSGFYQASSKACYLSKTQKLGSFNLQDGGFQSFLRVPAGDGGSHQPVVVYAIIGCSLGLILGMLVAFGWWYRRRRRASKEDEEDGFLESIPGLPTRFTYKQLQNATSGFSKKLGGGGFGSVYEGVLPDKTKIAVKQLESIGQGKKEFRAEVATIGSIHHVNLVRLHGFCSEGYHRLLVYEFLARGSLDKSLFPENRNSDTSLVLDWDTRYNIAVGTARGLAYLHEDCRERIIHCDIKPENILLDENFTAKVSDFGLAKLVNKEQSHVFTTMRGTRGYLAPEWLYNTAISERSDVYSFGMVLLEIVSGRKNFDPTETSDKWYIPAYAFKQAEVGDVGDVLDPRLKGFAGDKQVNNAVRIALWCIQEDPHLRPSMGRVLQMLEGIVGVPDPPLSSQFAVRLHERMVDAVSEREKYSEYNSQDLLSASYLSGPR